MTSTVPSTGSPVLRASAMCDSPNASDCSSRPPVGPNASAATVPSAARNAASSDHTVPNGIRTTSQRDDGVTAGRVRPSPTAPRGSRRRRGDTGDDRRGHGKPRAAAPTTAAAGAGRAGRGPPQRVRHRGPRGRTAVRAAGSADRSARSSRRGLRPAPAARICLPRTNTRARLRPRSSPARSGSVRCRRWSSRRAARRRPSRRARSRRSCGRARREPSRRCVMSAATCQNVTIGYQRIDGVRSRPGGSFSQSGRVNIRSSDHHTIGSEGCCRNSTRVPSHGASRVGRDLGGVGGLREPDGAAVVVARLDLRACPGRGGR